MALGAHVESGARQTPRSRAPDLGSEEVPMLPGDVLDRQIEASLLPQAVEAVGRVLGKYVSLHQLRRIAAR